MCDTNNTAVICEQCPLLHITNNKAECELEYHIVASTVNNPDDSYEKHWWSADCALDADEAEDMGFTLIKRDIQDLECVHGCDTCIFHGEESCTDCRHGPGAADNARCLYHDKTRDALLDKTLLNDLTHLSNIKKN